MKRCLSVCLLLLSMTAWAQPDFYKKDQPKPTRRQYVITLQDGSQLRGELIRQDSTEAVIRTGNLGQVTVKADQIMSMVAANVDETGRPVDATGLAGYPNLFPQYMHFTPTAHQAERGKGYFRNTFFYISQFDYGITDNWSVGTAFFTVIPSALFSLNTKLSVPVGEGVRLGVQGQYISGNNLFDNGQFGTSYLQGIATIGTPQRNVTVGIGSVFTAGKLSDTKVFTVGLVRKVSPSLSFISENHVFLGRSVDTNLSLSGGVRFDRRRHAFDVAVLFPFISGGNTSIVLLPFASYQLRFGK